MNFTTIKYFFFALLLPIISYGQKQIKAIQNKDIGELECFYSFEYEPGKDDTTYYISIYFKNGLSDDEFDNGIIRLYSRDELNTLIKDIETIRPYAGKQGTKYIVQNEKYSIKKFESSETLGLWVGDKLCTITSADLDTWVEWLKTVKFPGS